MLCTIWHLVIIIAWVYLVTSLQGAERTFRCTDKLPYFLLTYSTWPPTNHFGVLIMWRCTLEKRTVGMQKKNEGRGRKERTDKRSREQTNRQTNRKNCIFTAAGRQNVSFTDVTGNLQS